MEWMQNPKQSFNHETKMQLKWKWKQWCTLLVEVTLLHKYTPVKLPLLLLFKIYLHIVLFEHSECILYHSWWNECNEMILWCCHSADLAGSYVCSPDIHWCLQQLSNYCIKFKYLINELVLFLSFSIPFHIYIYIHKTITIIFI